MKKKLLLLVFPVLALILEMLPYGVELHFANPEGARLLKTYAYFDMTPYAYAHFWPFLTAILTVPLFVIAVILCVRYKAAFLITNAVLSIIALIFSILSLLFGEFSSIQAIAIAIGISASLLAELIVCWRLAAKESPKVSI